MTSQVVPGLPLPAVLTLGDSRREKRTVTSVGKSNDHSDCSSPMRSVTVTVRYTQVDHVTTQTILLSLPGMVSKPKMGTPHLVKSATVSSPSPSPSHRHSSPSAGQISRKCPMGRCSAL
ncbi:hypothetical protein RRG08_042574 [Elysia crispata]|uniref:Uncharacterized protein n=1 Tax=Elysia crispata TaxID=231223 RepID=A0AAE0XPV7_9GAST|nr:hypothetical protein RRG08_042574 [Elysia crispata]